MAKMLPFKSGENLAKEFPGSLFIKYGDLDARAMAAVHAIKIQIMPLVGGPAYYGSATALIGVPLLWAGLNAWCVSVHYTTAKHNQNLFLKMLSK